MEMRANTQGLSELLAKMKAAPAAVTTATRGATLTASKLMVAEVRSNIRGAPRWGHRGKSRVYRENLTVSSAKGDDHGGPPGRFSGALVRGVGYKKIPVMRGAVVIGGVGIGGVVNNLKKRYLEEHFPFFHDSIQDVEHDVFALYDEAWLRVIREIMG